MKHNPDWKFSEDLLPYTGWSKIDGEYKEDLTVILGYGKYYLVKIFPANESNISLRFRVCRLVRLNNHPGWAWWDWKENKEYTLEEGEEWLDLDITGFPVPKPTLEERVERLEKKWWRRLFKEEI